MGLYNKKELFDVLVENSTYQSNKLRIKLLQEGMLPYRCNRCLLEKWMFEPIPLELDHKNGNNSDNRLENLQLLCPNCHAQTPHYRGKNIGNAGNKHHYKKPQ